MKERIEYLDSLKGVCILLVVYCHFPLLPRNSIMGNFLMSLAWSSVPCFMIVSGGLMHQSAIFNYKKYACRLGKIYLGLCIWRFLYYLIERPFVHPITGKVKFFEYLFFFTDLDGINTGVMWYMFAYLLVMLLFPVTFYLFHHHKSLLIFLGFLSALSGILLPSFGWCLNQLCSAMHIDHLHMDRIASILPFSHYSNMIFYFIAGSFLVEYRHVIKEKMMQYHFLLYPGILLCTVGLMAIKYCDSHTFRWESIYLQDGYSHIFTLLLSVGVFLLFAGFEQKPISFLLRFFGLIGRYTMGIYYLHYVMLFVLHATLYSFFTSHYFFGMNALKAFCITLFCLLLTSIIRKIPLLKNLVM